MIGAIWAIVTFHRSEKRCGFGVTPNVANRSASEPSTETAKVCTRPISSEATNAPDSEPSPPTTMTTNKIGPSSRRHVRLA